MAILGTPLLIGEFRMRSIGQQIRVDGPAGHFSKAGTPTMGGLAIMGATVAGYIVAHVSATFTTRGLVGLLTICGAALVGFIDDWLKVTRQRSLGLNKRAKIAGQFVVAVAFAVVVVEWLKVDTHLSFTRFNSLGLQLGKPGWAVFAVLVIVGTMNAVNLTDGLDGLASGSSAFTFVAFTVIGFYQLRHEIMYKNPASLDEAVMAAALIGACAGFLWWNAAPAKIFMGDTGSLGIGAAIGVLALLENVDLLLPLIGGLYVIETLSVIAQVASYRLFGRRIFRMAPVHHHFELLGWPETTVIVRFWILAGSSRLFPWVCFMLIFSLTGGRRDGTSARGGGRALVIGFGVSGRAAAHWLVSQRYEVVVLEDDLEGGEPPRSVRGLRYKLPGGLRGPPSWPGRPTSSSPARACRSDIRPLPRPSAAQRY